MWQGWYWDLEGLELSAIVWMLWDITIRQTQTLKKISNVLIIPDVMIHLNSISA